MITPAIVGLLAVILTYWTRDRQNGIGLKMAFGVIFIFLALRYDYGNDYMAYYNGFYDIASYDTVNLTNEMWEPGWIFLYTLFKPLGFFALVAFTSLATCIVMYRFVRNFVPAQYQWLAIFLYCFNPYLFLVPASAMRQNIGVLIFLVAIEFLYKRKFVIYTALAFAAALFHKSGLVLPLILIVALINIKVNKLVAALFILFFIALFVFGSSLVPYFNILVSSHLEKYEGYLLGQASTFNSGLGFLYALFQLCAVLYFSGVEFSSSSAEYSEQQYSQPTLEMEAQSSDYPLSDITSSSFLDMRARRLLFKIALLTFIFTPLGLQIPMIGRINMYFTPALIAIYPIIFYTTKDKFFYAFFMVSLMAFTLFQFLVFFLSPVWRDKFGSYQTILSAF